MTGDRYLTAAEVGEILGINERTVARLAAQGRSDDPKVAAEGLRSAKWGHRTLRFSREDVDAFVEAHSSQPRRRRRRAS